MSKNDPGWKNPFPIRTTQIISFSRKDGLIATFVVQYKKNVSLILSFSKGLHDIQPKNKRPGYSLKVLLPKLESPLL